MRSPLLRRALIGGGVVLLVVGLYAAWLAWRVQDNLSAAAGDAEQVRAAIDQGDTAQLERALAELNEHSRAAADSTDDPVWTLLGALPVIGDDADGIAVGSEVLADLSGGAAVDAASSLDRLESLLPQNGRFRIGPISDLASNASAADDEFQHARERLASQDPSGFVDPLRTQYEQLERQVADTADALRAAATALELMPGMLGTDGPRNHLLVFQNNAEIRATGGLPGATALLRAEGGRLEMTRQVAGNQFGMADRPVLPLTDAEEQIYSDALGTFFLAANLTPDFPRAAELMRARWEQRFPGERLDSVVSLDTVAISYLLEATGPLEVAGVRLTADNVVDELLHNTYLRYEDPAQQDAFFGAVALAVFDRALGGTSASPRDVLAALSRAADEWRLQIHSFRPKEQERLAGTAVAGELERDPDAPPQVGVYLNDGTASKMSYFLRYDVDVEATSCQDDVQQLTGTATLRSEAPADADALPAYVTGGGVINPDVKTGAQWAVTRIYGPAGGTVEDVRLDGRPLEVTEPVDHDGRPVVTVIVELSAGESADLTWTMSTGPGQSEDAVVRVTPGIISAQPEPTVASACR